MTTTKTSKPAPPEAAVQADAHWAAKMERLRQRALAETTFVICDDQEVRSRYQRARRNHDLAQDYLNAHPDDEEARQQAGTAAAEYVQAKTAYDEASIPLRFRALPRLAFEGLLKTHAPSEKEAEEGRQWADSFPAALIAAASVDGMTEDEARDLLDAWSLAEANAMFNAAYSVQDTTRADVGKG
ncbi:hypothetical protein [Streptomyces longwoodensis]|uniref:hypothetical protein n=1 Tax=Streptomyces longwoodensis TaxID=68231 RepID=UPI0022574F3C|nr:hypothetical protein [Streptomyces longwoodensis]MCX5000987.1 hypothetical protein [Streptomyces longwoodensis]